MLNGISTINIHQHHRIYRDWGALQWRKIWERIICKWNIINSHVWVIYYLYMGNCHVSVAKKKKESYINNVNPIILGDCVQYSFRIHKLFLWNRNIFRSCLYAFTNIGDIFYTKRFSCENVLVSSYTPVNLVRQDSFMLSLFKYFPFICEIWPRLNIYTVTELVRINMLSHKKIQKLFANTSTALEDFSSGTHFREETLLWLFTCHWDEIF